MSSKEELIKFIHLMIDMFINERPIPSHIYHFKSNWHYLDCTRIKKIGFSSAQSLSQKPLKNDDETNWEVQEALGRVQLLEKKLKKKKSLLNLSGMI